MNGPRWVRVTTCESVPVREGRAVVLAGREIAIFNLGDRFLATDNRCPHQGGPLCDGIVAGESVVCPLHAWKVRLESGVVERPASHDARIETYPTRVEAGIVWLALPPGLEEETGHRVRNLWQERARRPGRSAPAVSFRGRRVLTLESRRSPELALLVLNYGGKPVIAPSLREVPLESNQHALAFAAELIEQRFGMVILMTGVGLRLLVKIVEPVYGRDAFVHALARTRLVARGPKPMAALRELGLTAWATVPSPNTWRELLATLDARIEQAPLDGLRVAVQEYGLPNSDFIDALQARGSEVMTVPIYRWSMPEDLDPLRKAVHAIVRQEIDIVILTASIQLVHLLRVAAEMGLEGAVREGVERLVVASIGPMTSEELRSHGMPIDLEASHPKMGFLVKEAAEQCDALLQAKRCIERVE